MKKYKQHYGQSLAKIDYMLWEQITHSIGYGINTKLKKALDEKLWGELYDQLDNELALQLYKYLSEQIYEEI